MSFNPSFTPGNEQSRGLFPERVSHAILGKLIHYSVPQFPHPKNGCNNSNYPVGSLRGLNKRIHAKFLEQFMVHKLLL